MADFMMIMKARQSGGGELDWADYIEAPIATGKFRGGSALGNGGCFSKLRTGGAAANVVVGFMRFEADSLDEVRVLLSATRTTRPAARSKSSSW